MDLTQIIIIIVAILVAWIVFKLVTGFIFKIVLPILILLIVGYFAFKYYKSGNLIENITVAYCEGNDVDEVKCECFVKPIISDLESRLSAEDLIELKNNSLKSAEEFHKSYKNKQEEINSCFESKGKTKNMADDLFEDIKDKIFNIGNK